MLVYFIRHGETFENKAKVLQGHFDGKLNETGKKQAKEKAEKLAGVQFDRIYSSDLSRAYNTAKAIQQNQDCDIKVTPQLRERTFGVYDKHDITTIMQQEKIYSPVEFYKYVNTAEGAESDRNARNRADNFLNNTLIPSGLDKVCVVSHEAFLRCILGLIFEESFKNRYANFRQRSNTEIKIFEYDGNSWEKREGEFD